ncbi:hypothetical protein HYQ46_000972 [Verticillium longisporum]|nr:hypothetical protein HYQ46_000972 [Verticillium longisporum]
MGPTLRNESQAQGGVLDMQHAAAPPPSPPRAKPIPHHPLTRSLLPIHIHFEPDRLDRLSHTITSLLQSIDCCP